MHLQLVFGISIFIASCACNVSSFLRPYYDQYTLSIPHIKRLGKRNIRLHSELRTGNDNLEAISEDKLKLLLSEREKHRLAILALDIAINKVQGKAAHANTNVTTSLNYSELPYNYGFISKSAGSNRSAANSIGGSNVPANAIILSSDNLKREFIDLLRRIGLIQDNSLEFGNNSGSRTDFERQEFRRKLNQLVLSNDAIWKREAQRPAIQAPWVIKIPYYALCILLDKLFNGKPISRFYFLETVARMPYFSYITMLHTYETLGWWRRSTDAKRVHFAEEFNEFHHLLIWESLGGDQDWEVRFFAQHSAIVYFFVLIALWVCSPSLAYNFSELIEAHAVDTYAEFAEANRDLLQSLPPPEIAKAYYEAADMYVFDEFQTSRRKGSRRPVIRSLYDVVCNIRDDESAHVATMAQCQDPAAIVRSPNTEAAVLAATVAAAFATFALLESGGSGGLASTASDNLLDSLTDIVTSAATVTSAVASAVGEKLSDVSAGLELRGGDSLSSELEESFAENSSEAIIEQIMRIISRLRL